jgi:hypothetical protein
MAPPPLPTFLIIGAERSATRWLWYNLVQQPDVFIPKDEIGFFSDLDKMNELRSHWYRQQFDGWFREPCRGERAPSYMAWGNRPHDMAASMHSLMPDIRLVAIVRDPVDRMYSAMVNHMKWGRIPPDTDLYTLISTGDERAMTLDLIGRSIYFQSLTSYDEMFGDQLLTLFYEDVRDHPEQTYETVLHHIGASTDFLPEHLDRVRYANGTALDPPRPTPEEHRDLYEWFRVDVDRLQDWTGRDLTHWDPGPGGKPNWLMG